MAVSVDNTPPPAIRGNNFSFTVSFSETTGGSINSVNVSFDKLGDPITITEGISSFSSQGIYYADWQDIFTYVDTNESNKSQTPKTKININQMPPDKNLYNLNQDLRDSINRVYTCTVSYTDNLGSTGSDTISIVHTVNNDLETIRSFMDNYNYNNYKEK